MEWMTTFGMSTWVPPRIAKWNIWVGSYVPTLLEKLWRKKVSALFSLEELIIPPENHCVVKYSEFGLSLFSFQLLNIYSEIQNFYQ